MLILDYLSTGPVFIILAAIFFVPLWIRKNFDAVNDYKITNIIHILIVIIGIIVTIPIYNANPGMKLYESSKAEKGIVDEFDNTEYGVYLDAKSVVEQQLKAPATAKFCKDYEAEITLEGNTWTVRGWVESQNSFGAMLRDEFTVEMSYTGKHEFSVEYLEIGDTLIYW